jgi:hypothetical protein
MADEDLFRALNDRLRSVSLTLDCENFDVSPSGPSEPESAMGTRPPRAFSAEVGRERRHPSPLFLDADRCLSPPATPEEGVVEDNGAGADERISPAVEGYVPPFLKPLCATRVPDYRDLLVLRERGSW